MKKGLLITIEGTDCSGKETQSNLLVEELNKHNLKTIKFCFPRYNSPTGQIIAGPYLGKDGYQPPLFDEGAVNVDPMVASLYFAADRKYNIHHITNALDSGINVVVDRYVDSNLAHQGSKKQTEKEQDEMFEILEKLEYEILGLPKPDITMFLYMPTSSAKILKQNRTEKPDQHEADENYLLHSENTYLRLSKRRGYIQINCTENNRIKTIQEIHEEIKKIIINKIKK